MANNYTRKKMRLPFRLALKRLVRLCFLAGVIALVPLVLCFLTRSPEFSRFIGVVETDSENVGPLETARIVAIDVRPGQTVSAGEVLARLAPPDRSLELAMNAARLKDYEQGALRYELNSERYRQKLQDAERRHNEAVRDAERALASERLSHARDVAELESVKAEIARLRPLVEQRLIQETELSRLRPAASGGLAWIRTNPLETGDRVAGSAWQAPLGTVPRAVVLRAIAVDATGRNCAAETSGTYFIGAAFANRTLPAVSITTEALNLFGFTQGLYVPGKLYADSPVGYGSNRWGKPYANYHQANSKQEWERPAYLEFFEAGQSAAAFELLMGVAMHGGGSRAIPQKTLYMLSRKGEYGTFFRSLAVPVRATADSGYVFDGWVGTASINPEPLLFVDDEPITLTARFRPAGAPAYQPTPYESWASDNFSEQELLGSGASRSRSHEVFHSQILKGDS